MATSSDLFTDGITELSAGMNSGLSPELLEKNQTAFSTNCSHRGGYAGCRPPITKIGLNFGGDSALATSVRSGLWQGGNYFKSEYGEEGFVISISGRIFFLVDRGAVFDVRDITPLNAEGEDDPNASGNEVAWIWQAERWAIITDGQSLPIFFDGKVTRRSRGASYEIGELAVAFNAPAIGSTVEITLVEPYEGPINEVIYIGQALYQVNSSSDPNAYSVTLKTLFSANQPTFAEDVPIGIPQNLLGQNSLAWTATIIRTVPGGFFGAPPVPIYGMNVDSVVPTISSPVGRFVTFMSGSAHYISGNIVAASTGGFAGNWVDKVPQGSTFPAGAQIFDGYPNISFPLGFVIASDFTPAAQGGSAIAKVKVPFNGAIGTKVVIGSGLYEITATNNTPTPSTTVSVTSVIDQVGVEHPIGDTLTTLPELPVGKMGAYGMGRNWMALSDGRSFIGGDIVGGSSGSPALNNRDAVLKVTENSFLAGGGTFVVPGNVGDIRAMWFTATMDQSLGQGPLQIGTPTSIFSCITPVDRSTWDTISNPILTQSLIGKGPLGQYGTILVNSDTIFRANDGLASLILARRDFTSWGNVPISREMQKVVNVDDESLLNNATAIEFNNRVLVGCLPVRGPLGVYHQGIISMNLDPVSSLRGKAASIYDGFWTGLNVFQFVTGLFGGESRSFAFVFNRYQNDLDFYELKAEDDTLPTFDNETIPVSWSFETSLLFDDIKGKSRFDEVELKDGEIYLSNIRGVVNIQSWYRPDYSECWIPWHAFTICGNNLDTDLSEQFRTRLGLGEPTPKNCEPTNNKPYRIGSAFQFRFQITGSCKFKGAVFKASKAEEQKFAKVQCDEICGEGETENCEPCKDQGDCLRFPLVFYSLNDHKSYSNPLLSFPVECPNGTTQQVYVPAGTINYTLPFPPNFAGPYPPLVMGCLAGGLVVRKVPDNATQQQIDDLVQDMMNECARAYAEANATCEPASFSNDVVYYVSECPEGETLEFTGSLPDWITLDTENSRLVGAAGQFTSNSKAAANALAQNALDTFAVAQIDLGNLACSTPTDICTDGVGDLINNIYQIANYVDGMFDSISSDPATIQPAWDGTFNTVRDNGPGLEQQWYAGEVQTLQMNGFVLCNAALGFDCFSGPEIIWSVKVGDPQDGPSSNSWYGEKVGGGPEGVYVQTDGVSSGPATVEIILIGTGTTPLAGAGGCVN